MKRILFLRNEVYVLSAGLLVLAACTPPSSAPKLSDVRIGHCEYTGPFSKLPECKDYLGEWKVSDAEKDCTGDNKGKFEGGSICNPSVFLGACLIAKTPQQTRTYIATDNTAKCGSARTGCETFGGGYWDAAPICGGANDELVVPSEGAFREPVQKCFMPASGEPMGHSDGGMVCVWEGIHGATEEGRSFRNDANCDNSRSGRPYYPKDPGPHVNDVDPRQSDPAYLAEEAWVRSQLNAASCVCCHSSGASPNNAPSLFDVDRAGSLANQLTDRGVAQGAGVVSTVPLGAWPKERNNGFAKSDLAHPDWSVFLSTDPARMKAFWQREMEHRGLTAADMVGVPDGLGPLSEQFYFQPQACTGSEGIAADGTITWGKGKARYVYVMAATSRAPTVFPNLDLPEGTVWRLDVPPEGAPLVSGNVKYGVLPEGTSQKFPVAGAPAALTSGTQYFLYVTADQMLPITRCLITAP
ncbi:MAG: hypothetical protein U0228_11150 [Myxococcaceae bacterium]